MNRRILILAILLAVSGPAIEEPNAQAKHFYGIGQVISIDEDQSGLKIRHKAIEGYTPVMSMHFKIEASEVLNGVKAGQRSKNHKRNQHSTRPAVWSAALISSRNTRDLQASQAPASPIDFELTNLEGRQVKLADYRGKIVLVNFWATWCGPCQFEIPIFVEMKRKFQKRGLEVIGVSMDDGPQEQVAEFVKQYEINYPVVMGAFAQLEAFGNIKGVPTTFIIDRKGRIHSRHHGLLGLNKIERELTKLLKAK